MTMTDVTALATAYQPGHDQRNELLSALSPPGSRWR
jgi:hypothetical protein